ncbi:MAG: ImmA/IrrE family metallo-endopeptidase, partial [Acidimicrobiia bacterium]
VSLAAELASWIEDKFELPPTDLPDLRDVPPDEAATVLRSMWSLGEVPAPNMVHLLEAHGVRVFSLVDDCKALDAISCWIDDRPFVFLTRHKSPERARWDAAHELGHLVLHLGAPPHGKEQEDQADEFAGAFLLPARGVRARAPRYPALPDVLQEKLHWRVSALAYLRCLEKLNILTEWRYRSLVIEASQAGYRRQEGDIEREASQLIPKVLAALEDEGIGIPAIAAELDINSSELRGLLFAPLNMIAGGTARAQGSRPELRLVQ